MTAFGRGAVIFGSRTFRPTVRFPIDQARVAFVWDGKVNGRALPPGSYRTTATLTDPAGNRGVPETVAFTVLP